MDSLPDLSIPPGAALGAVLSQLDLATISDELLLDLIRVESRQLSHHQARVYAVMAELARRPVPVVSARHSDDPFDAEFAAQEAAEAAFEATVDEVRAALHQTRRSARFEVTHAVNIAALPRVEAALRAGRLDKRRAVVLADTCWDLTAEQVESLLDELLDGAERLTATQLSDKARRTAIALDPEWAARRYRAAVRDRKVVGRMEGDGSITITGQGLPVDEATAALARMDRLAWAAKRAGAHSTLDILRADLLLALIDGEYSAFDDTQIVDALINRHRPDGATTHDADGADADADADDDDDDAEDADDTDDAEDADADRDTTAGSGRGRSATPAAASARAASTARITPPAPKSGVHVRVSLATLLGLNDEPGELPGWGPILAPVARSIVADQIRAEWRYVSHDEQGHHLRDGLLRARPIGAHATQPRRPRAIVEILVPQALLESSTLERYPSWAPVLAELMRPAAPDPLQDPQARFAGEPLRRKVQLLIQWCLFPGCRRPAISCDLDHRDDHALGGKTVEINLGPACRHDHGNKTRRGWRLIRTGPLTYRWISPHGGRFDVTLDPVAPPLPKPIPRPPRAEPVEVEIDTTQSESLIGPDSRSTTLPGSDHSERSAMREGLDPPPF